MPYGIYHMKLIDQNKRWDHSTAEKHGDQKNHVKKFSSDKFFFDIGYAANNVTNTEIAANASEYKNEFKNPRQIIPFSSTRRYASSVQSLM